MNIGSFIKQPVEVKDYDIDYSEWLTPGDNVQHAEIDVNPAGSLLVESVHINDPRVKVWVSGGDNGVTYKLTITTDTADGRVKQDEFKIKVKDT